MKRRHTQKLGLGRLGILDDQHVYYMHLNRKVGKLQVAEQGGMVYGIQTRRQVQLFFSSRSHYGEQFSGHKHLGEGYEGHFLHILSTVPHGPGGKTLPFLIGLMP